MIVIESINHVGLTVANLDKSIQFYTDLFDFEVVEKIDNSQEAFIRIGDILIGLYEDEEFTGQRSNKKCISFYIDEEDFEDALEELKDNDIAIVYGPENIRNGKTLIFMDPDGNHIELCYPKMYS